MKCLAILLMTSVCYGFSADLNGSGRVDFVDFAIFADQWLEEDMSNQYLTFNGTTGYITVLDDATLNFGTGDFSICFWMLATNASNKTCIGKVSGLDGYRLSLSTTAAILNIRVGAANANISAGTLLNDGMWKFICFSCDRDGNGVPYVNGTAGTPVNISAVGDIDVASDLLIGKIGSQFLAGSLDDLRIYKGIALSQAQVNTIYNAGSGKKYAVGDAGAGLAFNMDEGTGTAIESVGTATLTGTFTGGVTWQNGGVPLVLSGAIQSADYLGDLWAW